MKYYYLTGHKENGPVTINELKELDLTSETYIWTNRMKVWTQLKDLPEIAQELNIIYTPPPIPSHIKRKIRIPSIKNINPKTKRIWISLFRYFVLGILCLLFSIGWITSQLGAHYPSLETVSWFIGFPLAIISSMLLNFLYRKWKQSKEKADVQDDDRDKDRLETDNTGLFAFLLTVLLILIIIFILNSTK